MKFKGLVAAVAALFVAAPLAFAGAAHAAPAPAAPKLEKEQLAKGAKDVPALIAAAGVTCTPDQAYFMGTGQNPQTKKEVSAYEVSCKEGLGYFLQSTKDDPKPNAIDCASLPKLGRSCMLPGNAHPELALAARARSAGRTCTPTKALYVGGLPDGTTYYELACSEGSGFQMGVKGPDVTIDECLVLSGSGRACTLTTSAQVAASLQPLVTSAGKSSCQVKDQRYIGASGDGSGDRFIEVACQSGPGFILRTDKNLAFKAVVECREAEGLAGGCRMTDTSVTQTSDNATYTALAKKAGYDCDVSKYRFIGVNSGDKREVVELACSNRPDGAVAYFSETGKSDVYDCARVGGVGQICRLTTTQPLFAKYQKDLAAKGKTCTVTGVDFLAHTNAGDFVELACSAPPGWAISYPAGSNEPGTVYSCPQIKARGVACKLPSNVGQ